MHRRLHGSQNASQRRLALAEPATLTPEKIAHPRALQHLKEGFNRRVLMIDVCVRRIHEQADERGGKPLSALLVPELAVFVNAFWLNICGALDNLAWALNYELQLFPTAREDVGHERKGVGLFTKSFRKTLSTQEPAFWRAVESFDSWYADLANLRDPGAHRIPIYPIPGVMNEATGTEAKRLYAKAEAHFQAGNTRAGMALIDRGYNLAAYEPWIALSHAGKTEFKHMVREVDRDEESFVSLSEVVLQRLFR